MNKIRFIQTDVRAMVYPPEGDKKTLPNSSIVPAIGTRNKINGLARETF